MASENDRIEQLQKMTRRPSTPGEIVLGLLEEMEISGRALARRMGVSPQTVSELTRNRRTLTADVALRLGRAFGTSAAMWMNLQRNVDLWDVLHADASKYASIEPLTAPRELAEK